MRLGHRLGLSDTYGLSITGNATHTAYAVACSNNKIQLMDANTLKITTTLDCQFASDASFHSYQGKSKVKAEQSKGFLTDVLFHPTEQSIVVAGMNNKDGSILVFDTRVHGSKSQEWKSGAPCSSFSFNSHGHVLVSGTEKVDDDAVLVFWDIRQGGQTLGVFDNVHADDITQTRFHPHHPTVLMTGSTDGTICLFDISNGLDEDEALQYSIVDNSIHKLGFFGPQNEYIYALTHIETCSLLTSDLSFIAQFGDVRSQFEASNVDYLMDCKYLPQEQNLVLLAGNQRQVKGIKLMASGHVSVLKVYLENMEKVATWQGHSDIVRSVHFDTQRNRFITSSEDGTVCTWEA